MFAFSESIWKTNIPSWLGIRTSGNADLKVSKIARLEFSMSLQKNNPSAPSASFEVDSN